MNAMDRFVDIPRITDVESIPPKLGSLLLVRLPIQTRHLIKTNRGRLDRISIPQGEIVLYVKYIRDTFGMHSYHFLWNQNTYETQYVWQPPWLFFETHCKIRVEENFETLT